MVLPWVILYNAVSLDGKITGFDTDTELYYELAANMDVDAVLAGSNTILTGLGINTGENVDENSQNFKPRVTDPEDTRPLLVVPDSKGKIRNWTEIQKMPYIRDVLVLCSRSTPREYLDFLDERYIDYLVVGYHQVDLEIALDELNTKFKVKKVRVDGGGVLNGVLLSQGLVDEIHVLIHPELVGSTVSNSIFQVPDMGGDEIPIKLYLDNIEKIKDDLVYLKYKIYEKMFQR